MILDTNTPPYHFAITTEIESRCPFLLGDKQILAEDFLPTRTRPKDTGYDVRCAEPEGLELIPGSYFKMRLGFRVYAPEGWWLQLSPRSSTFMNYHVHALYGVIDETYENEMCFVGHYLPDASKLLPSAASMKIAFGQRFAQLLPCPRWTMPVLRCSNEEIEQMYKKRNDSRGIGGYGSSGLG